MSWEKVRLEDICISITDGDHQSLPLAERGIPFIVIANINSTNRIEFEKTRYVPIDYYEKLDEKRKPSKGDVLLTVKGSFGIPVYVDTDSPFVFQRDIAIFKCNEKVNSMFLFYYMKNREFYLYADSVAIGAAQRALTLKLLKNTIVTIPSLEKQDKIVELLAPYDKLISNNQKQIKLLEEAAQRLYKEWFVDFRFPGYENVKIVDGVPEGWKRGTLGDIGVFKRGKTITRKQIQSGKVPVVAGGLEPAYYHNKANTVSPVITVSGSGANAGFVRLYNIDVFASDCSFVDSATTPYIFFVYCFLKENKSSLDTLQKGAAQPHVYAKDINALELEVPTENTLESYCKFVSEYFEKIKVLQRQIEILSQARDRLLPKLMRGEIEV